MELTQQLKNKIDNNEPLTDEDLKEFAQWFVEAHTFAKDVSSIVGKYGEPVVTQFNLSKVISANMPRLTANKLGKSMTLDELKKAYPFNDRIIRGNEVLDFKSASRRVLNDPKIRLSTFVDDPDYAFRKLKDINAIDLADVRYNNKAKAIEQAQKNIDYLEKNQAVLEEHDYFKIVNDSHEDVDICDEFIDNVYTNDDIVRPPYHINCRCDVVGITKEEYNSNK